MNSQKLKKLRKYIKAQPLVAQISRNNNGSKRYDEISTSKVAFSVIFIQNQQL